MTITPVSIALPSLALGDDEAALVKHHLEALSGFERTNKVKEAYYEGLQRLRNLGISIPPHLTGIAIAVGWPGITVDVLEERLDWLGWSAEHDDLFGLDEVYRDNGLELDSGLGHLDALLYGTAFVAVGSGFDGEPHPLVTVESPRHMTGDFDPRIRRLSSALSIDASDDTGPTELSLYLPNSNLTLHKGRAGWAVEDRDEHNLGRVTVVQMMNRGRASRQGGRSEISAAVMGYTDQAVRTLLGMEVNREFYSAPQRYLLGADEGAFQDSNGNTRTGWEAVMGRFLAIPTNEDGEKPEVGQFTPASPAPYLEQVRGLAQMLAGEAAIPSTYLGFQTENPASADAIRAAEARLVKRAERRQIGFGRAWREVGALALLIRDGEIPEDYASVSNRWRDAATPTRSAAADETTKYVGSGILPPDSTVTWDRMGLTPAEQRRLAADQRRATARQTITALSAAATAAREDTDVIDLEARRGESG